MKSTILQCPICDLQFNECDLKTFEIDCQFIEIEGINQHLIRHQCLNCGVIFGTQQMLKLSREQLKEAYQKVFATGYTDGNENSVNMEVYNLLALNPTYDGIYLNYGAGTSTASKKAKLLGYNLIDYDPFVLNEAITNIDIILYDGIISHNLMEHFQDPIKELKLMKSMLKPGAAMIHSTECYKYKYAHTKFHFFFFEGKSLDIICEKVGLKYTYIGPWTIRYDQV